MEWHAQNGARVQACGLCPRKHPGRRHRRARPDCRVSFSPGNCFWRMSEHTYSFIDWESPFNWVDIVEFNIVLIRFLLSLFRNAVRFNCSEISQRCAVIIVKITLNFRKVHTKLGDTDKTTKVTVVWLRHLLPNNRSIVTKSRRVWSQSLKRPNIKANKNDVDDQWPRVTFGTFHLGTTITMLISGEPEVIEPNNLWDVDLELMKFIPSSLWPLHYRIWFPYETEPPLSCRLRLTAQGTHLDKRHFSSSWPVQHFQCKQIGQMSLPSGAGLLLGFVDSYWSARRATNGVDTNHCRLMLLLALTLVTVSTSLTVGLLSTYVLTRVHQLISEPLLVYLSVEIAIITFLFLGLGTFYTSLIY